jgi:hypothetical protein
MAAVVGVRSEEESTALQFFMTLLSEVRDSAVVHGRANTLNPPVFVYRAMLFIYLTFLSFSISRAVFGQRDS